MINLFYQLARFGLIGLLAAGVHFSVLFLLVEKAGLVPLQANCFAFVFGFQVSYWGHRCWTFRGTTALHRVALPKLLLVGITGFVINEALFSFFLIAFNLPYPLALFLTLTVLPIVSFALGKFWIFK